VSSFQFFKIRAEKLWFWTLKILDIPEIRPKIFKYPEIRPENPVILKFGVKAPKRVIGPSSKILPFIQKYF